MKHQSIERVSALLHGRSRMAAGVELRMRTETRPRVRGHDGRGSLVIKRANVFNRVTISPFSSPNAAGKRKCRGQSTTHIYLEGASFFPEPEIMSRPPDDDFILIRHKKEIISAYPHVSYFKEFRQFDGESEY
ncbi:hypothetical protein TNCV_1264691 [Trichonephila clavipes]|nr:hypothetical protein TNCV_1264691 [Trichonephila clavipes]